MENALTITIVEVLGMAASAQLDAKYGACAGVTHFGAVTLSAPRSTKQNSTRYFDLPSDLAVALSDGQPCSIAPGVLVGTVKVDPAKLRVEGPGATMFQAIRQTSGVQNRLPALPVAWLAAIRAAV